MIRQPRSEQAQANAAATRGGTESGAGPTLFHVTHWKAGSQWIHRVLRELVPERIVAPRDDQAQFFVAPLRAACVYPTDYVTREQFRSMAPPAASRAFVVIRDLRDTLISAYFSLRYSHVQSAAHMEQWRRILETVSVEEGLLRLLDQWLPMCASIQESWIGYGEPVIRYEDLLTDDTAILEQTLIDHGGLAVSSEQLRAAVARSRFEAISSGRRRGQEDVRAHERKGIAGDWKNHFTPRVRSAFEKRYGELIARAGYAVDQSVASVRRHGERSQAPEVLSKAEVLRGYDTVQHLSPHIAHLSLWRSWECAALARFAPTGRTLSLGGRDGRYMRTLWPQANDVLAYEWDEGGAEVAALTGAYREVKVGTAESLAEKHASVDTVFASLFLSTARRLDAAIVEIHRCLRPGGRLICSVFTDRFLHWSPLPGLLAAAGHAGAADAMRAQILADHGLVNLLPVEEWREMFSRGAWQIESEVCLLPKFNGGSFLLMDLLWHTKRAGVGELGDTIFPFLAPNPNFAGGFRQVLAGLLDMETDWHQGVAAAFVVRKSN
jgi:SAM-dependent methyltransferase